MGRASRWLRNLLRGKKDAGNGVEKKGGQSPYQKVEKRRWSFARLGRECSDGSPPMDQVTAVMEKPPIRISYYEETTDVEKKKHAIAVAAATAAAADAAVVAAHAAVAVVKLTRQHGRGTVYGSSRSSSSSGISGGERWAAVKIQTSFRGFLARKAHRALRALVKLQALVRGYLVRKQAAATLYSMQALIRAQATARSQRCTANLLHVKDSSRFYPEIRHRRSLETRSEHAGSFHSRRLSATLDPSYNGFNGFDDSPKIVEMDPGRPKTRNARLNPTTASDSTNTDDSHSSPLQQPPHIPARLTIPDSTFASDWHFTGDECRFSTAQSTPRFLNATGQCTGIRTPARSVCYEGSGGGYNRRHPNLSSSHYNPQHPNYMAKTESFNAKVRSQSAPKQRPEPRKRLSLKEMVEARSSLSGVGMMRSCSKAQEVIQFKNAVVSRLEWSEEPNHEHHLHHHHHHHQCFQRRW